MNPNCKDIISDPDDYITQETKLRVVFLDFSESKNLHSLKAMTKERGLPLI